MAQGGNIPTSKTQTVTFYNTTGIIEKEKGIYLSPSFRNKLIGAEVRDIYLDVLNTTAVKDADYTGISISSWSPEDRTLTVRGNIDDFRLVTEEGDCLNYLVITRNVTKLVNNVSTTYKYYYGFFITGVAQAGGASVKLTLEPDTFTNVFYLHNKHQLTALEVNTTDYEPFNERMKNCHVNRQHYNRVKIEKSYTLFIEMNYVTVDPHLEVGKTITIDFQDQATTQVQGTIIDFDDRDIGEGDLMIWVLCDEQQEIGEPDNYSTFVYEGNNYTFDYTTQGISWTTNTKYLPDNLKIFLNQEESFRFKYQYRDKKLPFALSKVFTDEEVNLIKTTDLFSNLSSALKVKIINASLSFLLLEMKSQERVGGIVAEYYDEGDRQLQYMSANYQNKYEDFGKYCVNLVSPFFDVPALLKKYEADIEAFTFKMKLIGMTDSTIRVIPKADVIYEQLNKNAVADYVYSAYIVNDVGIEENDMILDLVNKVITFKCNSALDSVSHTSISTKQKGLYLASIFNGETQDPDFDQWICYKYNNRADYLAGIVDSVPDRSHKVFLLLMLSGRNERNLRVTINPEISVNLKTNFYDSVLDAEPYSFYSLSFLNYELPFNKNRYYENFIIDVTEYYSFNGAIKISFIPSYLVEGKEFLYYNEGLTFTLSSTLPMVSSSYDSYYYQNKAQMKNQYAVNDYNRGMDLMQHFLISGPNAVGYAAGKGGMSGGGGAAGASALLETANQFMQMADELIDWSQSDKVITMNQKAKLADVGAKPDNLKQAGSDVFYDLITSENRPFLNHYTIDEASYDSIAKFLERFGYQINLYDILHVNDRVGWNYVKLNSFDFNPAFDIMVGQEEELARIFSKGVTLLHNKTYLTNGHNYERILDE